MRFACDRCKTRYSIADERVRGKILKIRCKACANVITVKEGMEEPAEAVRVTGEVPQVGADGERVHRPTTMAPQSTVGSGGVAPPAPALTAAFTSAMSAPAPSQLEDEWYVSRDGEQQGPFGLRAAQAWVAQQPYDAELYCWCEGFDDWLPVDRIGHFRGLRARPQPPAVPAVAAPAAAPAPSRVASGPVPALQPGAALSAPAAAAAPRMVSGPVATVIGAPPVAQVAAQGAARMVSGPVATVIGAPPVAQVAARAPSGPVPAASAGGSAALANARAPSGPVAPVGSAVAPVMAPAVAPVASAVAPVGAPSPLAVPAPGAAVARSPAGRAEPELGSASSSGGFSLEEKPSFAASLAALGSPGPQAAAARPAFDAAPAPTPPGQREQPWPATSSQARGGFDAGDLGSNGFSSTASGSGLRSAQIASSFDDELEFGEVSRVVSLADLNKSAPKRAPAAAAAEPALAGGWSAPVSSGPGPGFGEAAAPALESGGRSEVPVVIPAAQRRTHALLLGLVAIGLIGAGVTAFLLLQGSSPEDPMLISESNRDVRDLTIRPDDPRRPVGAGSQEHLPAAPTRPILPRKGSGPLATGKVDPTPPPATGGKVEASGGNGPLTPLGGSEVEEMSQRNSSGLQRCYEQALKKDIFLDVKSIKVTISIDAAGVVNAVQMSSHGDHVLGQCMTSRIRNWRFRPNTRGLDAKFTVAFGRT